VRIITNKYICYEDYDTAYDSVTPIVQVDESLTMVNFVDITGKEDYRALQDGYIRTSNAFIMVFSCSDKHSIDEELDEYHMRIERVKDMDKVPMVIVLNKCDLMEKNNDEAKSATLVNTEYLKKTFPWIKEQSVPVLEMSVKNRINVTEAVHECIRQYRQDKLQRYMVKFKKNKSKKSSTCLAQ